MGRATLETFQSIPLDTVAAESGLTPARVPTDHRQANPTQRLLARHKRQGPEEILYGQVSKLTDRLKAATFLQAGETAEGQQWEKF